MTLDTQNKEVGDITIEKELKMILLRHWTLYDSISNSNYLVTKLKIGREPGMKSFKKFLVTLGCSIEQAKQKYQYMDATLRKDLKRKIVDISSEFGIEKVLVDSYLRQMTETMQISAIDEAYAVSALLEFPMHINSFNDEKEIEMDNKFSKH